MNLFYLLFSLLYFHSAVSETNLGSNEWIDPHDMNIDSKYKLKRSQSVSSDSTKDNHPGSSEAGDPHYLSHGKGATQFNNNNKDETTLIYLKRFVNLIIRSASESEPGSIILIGRYTLDTESPDYKYLTEFINQDKINVEELRKLDTVLSNAFSISYSHQILESIQYFQSSVMNLLNIDTLLFLAMLLSLYIVYALLRSNFSFWYIFRYLFLVIVIIDYCYRYKVLLEETESHNMQIKYSSKCDPKTMSWAQWFSYMTDADNCKEKQKVNPLDVVLLQMKSVIIVPITALGTAMGNLGREIWINLGYPWNIVIFPLMLIFLVLITAVIASAVGQTSMKINLAHLLHFQFGVQNKTDSNTRLMNSFLEVLKKQPSIPVVPVEKCEASKSIEHKQTKDNTKTEANVVTKVDGCGDRANLIQQDKTVNQVNIESTKIKTSVEENSTIIETNQMVLDSDQKSSKQNKTDKDTSCIGKDNNDITPSCPNKENLPPNDETLSKDSTDKVNCKT